jgi:hypothetical protein
MSKTGGLVLILGGLTVAAYVMSSDNDASGPDAAGQIDVAKTARVDVRPSADLVVPKPQPAFRPIASASARAAEPLSGFSAPVVVTVAPRPTEVTAAQSRPAAVPKDRDALARELQKELRRVGCYDGELNGVWTPMTRRAMKAFTDRVNATLPVDEPDAVLFTMVASQRDTVCGKPCPPGQGISEDGRCLPNAILAKATRKAFAPTSVAHLPKANSALPERPAPAITGWSTTTTAARASPPVVALAPAPTPAIALVPPATAPPSEGRMALAGPAPESAPAPPGTPLPVTASPPIAGFAPALKPQAPPKRVVQGEANWSRTMNSRRFESPN